MAANAVANAVFGVFGVLSAKPPSRSLVEQPSILWRLLAPVIVVIDGLQVAGLVVRASQGWPLSWSTWSTRILGLWRLVFGDILFIDGAGITTTLVIVWLSLINTVIVGVSFATGRHRSVLPVKTLSVFVAFTTSIGFIPLLEMLVVGAASPQQAVPNLNGSGQLVIQVVAGISIAVFVPFALAASLFVFDSNPMTTVDPMAGPSGLMNFFVTSARTVFVMLSAVRGENTLMAVSAAYAILATLVAGAIAWRQPYYNHSWPAHLQTALYLGIAWLSVGSVLLGIYVAENRVLPESQWVPGQESLAMWWILGLLPVLLVGWRGSVIRRALVTRDARSVVVEIARVAFRREAAYLRAKGQQPPWPTTPVGTAGSEPSSPREAHSGRGQVKFVSVGSAPGYAGTDTTCHDTFAIAGTGAATGHEPSLDGKAAAEGDPLPPRRVSEAGKRPYPLLSSSVRSLSSSRRSQPELAGAGMLPPVSERDLQEAPAVLATSAAGSKPRSTQAILRAVGMAGKLRQSARRTKRTNMLSRKPRSASSSSNKPAGIVRSNKPTDIVSQCKDMLLANRSLAFLPPVATPWEVRFAEAVRFAVLRCCRSVAGSTRERTATVVYPTVVRVGKAEAESSRHILPSAPTPSSPRLAPTREASFSGHENVVQVDDDDVDDDITGSLNNASQSQPVQLASSVQGSQGSHARTTDASDATDKALRVVVADSYDARRALAGLMTASFHVELAARALLQWPGLGSSARIAGCNLIFEAGLRCFETADVRVHFSRYIEHAQDDRIRALALTRQAASCYPGITERFAIFQRVRAAERSRQTTSLGRSGHGLDSAGFLEYRKLEKTATSSHMKAIVLLKQIWTRLALMEGQRAILHDDSTVRPVAKRLRRLHTVSVKATSAYARLINKYPRATTLLRQFGTFLLEVRCRPEGAETLFRRADEVEDEDSKVEAGTAVDAGSEGGHSSLRRSVADMSTGSGLGSGPSKGGGSEGGGSKTTGTLGSGDGAAKALLERSSFKIKDDDFKAVAGLNRGVAGGVIVLGFLIISAFATTAIMLSSFQVALNLTYKSAVRFESFARVVYNLRSVQLAATSANASLWNEYRAAAFRDTAEAAEAHALLRRNQGDAASSFMQHFELQLSEFRMLPGGVVASKLRSSNPSDAAHEFLVAARRILTTEDAAILSEDVLESTNADWWFATRNGIARILPALSRVTHLLGKNNVNLATVFHVLQIVVFSLMLATNLIIFFIIFLPSARVVASSTISLTEVIPLVLSLGIAKQMQRLYAKAERRLQGKETESDESDDSDAELEAPADTQATAASVQLTSDTNAEQTVVTSDDIRSPVTDNTGSASEGPPAKQDLLDDLLAPVRSTVSTNTAQRPPRTDEGGDSRGKGVVRPDTGSRGTGDDKLDRMSQSIRTENPSATRDDLAASLESSQGKNCVLHAGKLSPTRRRSSLLDKASLRRSQRSSHSQEGLSSSPAAEWVNRPLILNESSEEPSEAARGRAHDAKEVPTPERTNMSLVIHHAEQDVKQDTGATERPASAKRAEGENGGDVSVAVSNARKLRHLRFISRTMLFILVAIAALQSLIFYTGFRATEVAQEDAVELVASAERTEAVISSSLFTRELFIGPSPLGDAQVLLEAAALKVALARELHKGLRFGSTELNLQAADERYPLQTALMYGDGSTASFGASMPPFNASRDHSLHEYIRTARERHAQLHKQEGVSAGLSRFANNAERALDAVAHVGNVTLALSDALAIALEIRDTSSIAALLRAKSGAKRRLRGVEGPRGRLTQGMGSATAVNSSIVVGQFDADAHRAWALGPSLSRLFADSLLSPMLCSSEQPLVDALRRSFFLVRQESREAVQLENGRNAGIMVANLIVLAFLYWAGLRKSISVLLTEARLSHDFLDVIPPEALELVPQHHKLLTFFYGAEDDESAEQKADD